MLRDGLAGLINHGIGTVQERLIVNYYGKQEKGENSAVHGNLEMNRSQITSGWAQPTQRPVLVLDLGSVTIDASS